MSATKADLKEDKRCSLEKAVLRGLSLIQLSSQKDVKLAFPTMNLQ